jgi:hypothetical protein
MQYVFISYFREDSAIVADFLKALDASRIHYFIDERGLELGDQWKEEIRRKINGATVFLFCMSCKYYDRPDSYVHTELKLASERLLALDPSVPWFLPLCVDNCNLPGTEFGHGALSDYHAIRMGGSVLNAAQQCVRRIKQILSDPDVSQGTICIHSLTLTHGEKAVICGEDPLAELRLVSQLDFGRHPRGLDALHSLRSQVLMHDGSWMDLGGYWSIYQTLLNKGTRRDVRDSLHPMVVNPDSLTRFHVPAGRGSFIVAELSLFEQHSTHGASLGYCFFLHGSDPVLYTIAAGETRVYLVRKTPKSGFLWQNRPTRADLYITEMPPTVRR